MLEEIKPNDEKSRDETSWDSTLRPKNLSEYIGQNSMKEALAITIAAAKKRGEPIEHVLLHGGAGLGKTTLAHIIAREMGGNFRITSGPAIERAGDLAAIVTNLEEGDILFIDEIHRINKNIEEVLYPAMEEFVLDIIVGKGPSAKTLRLNLPRFALIGATTKLSQMSSPLRDRFGSVFRLEYYEPSEIAEIIKRSARILSLTVADDAVETIAARARRTPRVANRILKRVRDFGEVKNKRKLARNDCIEALALLDIDERGLERIDRKILETIITTFGGGPVGLNALAAAVGEEMETIEDIHEPFLLQIGFLERTPRGRAATEAAYEHVKIKNNSQAQKKLVI